jgi:hypothetical protein
VSKLALVLFLVSVALGCGGGGGGTPAPDPAGSYSTNFQGSENPISEGGVWINGGTTGLDWTNISKSNGRATGHEGSVPFSDATATLQGNWASDQSVQATVYAVDQTQSCGQEVEMRLRTTIVPHTITGYEVSFSTSSGYMIIVRWNGSFGNFTVLLNLTGSQYVVQSGDVVKATIVGNVISAYKNGVLMGQATDSAYTSGSPGMGFNLNGIDGCLGTNSNYGFTSFTALDSSQGPI